MAWNEPGGGNKDPWSGRGNDQGPPDLDEVVKKIQEKFGGLFGGGSSGDGGAVADKKGPSAAAIGIIAVIFLGLWLATGIYIVRPAERGVELRFGAYSATTKPGPHWHFPYPIEDVLKVDVDQISSFRHQAQMLTKDENIVDLELTVQSRVQDAGDYLFQDMDPDKTLKDAIETSVREVIGKSQLDLIMTQGRGAIADRIKLEAQNTINNYKTGIEITSVNIDAAKPPEQVKAAFDDAIKAREDKERQENQAEAYANEVVPKARGVAARQVADAKAYRDRVIAEAQGESSRFLSVLQEYKRAPEVTRQRLYLDAVEAMLEQSSKVMLDVSGSNSLMYLPLDKLLQQSSESIKTAPQVSHPDAAAQTSQPHVLLREPNRSRSTR